MVVHVVKDSLCRHGGDACKLSFRWCRMTMQMYNEKKPLSIRLERISLCCGKGGRVSTGSPNGPYTPTEWGYRRCRSASFPHMDCSL